MAYCTHCDQEYPAGTEECPVCRRLLWVEKPAWRPYDPARPLVEVATVQGEIQASLVKGQLEVAGIPVLVQREPAGVVRGLTVDGLGAQHILVPEELSGEAREILSVEQSPPPSEEPLEED